MYETKIGHAHLKVRDLDLTVAFYMKFLGLHETERVGNRYVFLTGGELHHEIALQRVEKDAPAPGALSTGLYHIAFEVGTARAFAEAYTALREAGIEVEAVDHLISWAMYFSDPSGNGLEIYWDTRGETAGRALWYGENVALPDEKILAALADKPNKGTA